MDGHNLFKLRHGSIELEIAGDPDYIKDTLQGLPEILAAFGSPRPIVGAQQLSEEPIPVTEGTLSESAAVDPPNNNLSEKGLTLNEYLRSMAVKSAIESAVCMVYFAEKHEDVAEFTTKDLTDWWKSSKLPLPRNLSDVISRACQKSYFNLVGKDKAMTYRLTRTGEELVREIEDRGDSATVKAAKRQPAAPRKAQESATAKAVTETPMERLTLEKYPDPHTIKSVIRQACWVMLVCRNELGIQELSAMDISLILSQKFSIKRTADTVASAFVRNPKAWDRTGRGKYRLMKHGEDIAMGRIEEEQ